MSRASTSITLIVFVGRFVFFLWLCSVVQLLLSIILDARSLMGQSRRLGEVVKKERQSSSTHTHSNSNLFRKLFMSVGNVISLLSMIVFVWPCGVGVITQIDCHHHRCGFNEKLLIKFSV